MRSARSTASATTSKPGTSSAPIAASPPASPPAAPPPIRGRTSTPYSLLVKQGQALEAPGEQLDLGRRGAFLGGKMAAASRKRVCTSQATTRWTPCSRLCGSRARSAARPPSVVAEPPTPDHHPLGPVLDRGRDQLARARGVGGHGVVALGAPDERQARCPGHLDHRRRAVDLPLRRDGRPSGSRTSVRAHPARHHVEQALASVGDGAWSQRPSGRLGGHVATAAATWRAVAVPRNLSGAATTWGIAPMVPCRSHPGHWPVPEGRGRVCLVECPRRSDPAGGSVQPRVRSPSPRDPDGNLQAKRASGGMVAVLGPGVSEHDALWLATALSDADRAATGAGEVVGEGYRLRTLTIDAAQFRQYYDVIANQTLWFLLHGLWDLPRRPRFDRHWWEAWRAFVTVNRLFAEAAAAELAPGATVLINDYQLALVRSRAAAAAARRPHQHLRPHPVLPSGRVGRPSR